MAVHTRVNLGKRTGDSNGEYFTSMCLCMYIYVKRHSHIVKPSREGLSTPDADHQPCPWSFRLALGSETRC